MTLKQKRIKLNVEYLWLFLSSQLSLSLQANQNNTIAHRGEKVRILLVRLHS